MASLKGVGILQEELLKVKENLKGFDANIKKLTGRDVSDGRPPIRRVIVSGQEDFRGRDHMFISTRRGQPEDVDGGPPAKRRAMGGAFGRLGPRVGANVAGPYDSRRRLGGQAQDSGDDEELPNKPTVQSSVVATPKVTRTRQQSIDQQQARDKEGKARSVRMFGLLLGTLQKFKAEETQKTEKVEKRKAVEQKLEQKARQEKEELIKERRGLFDERRQAQAKLRRLEHKMELVEIHQEWESQTKNLMHFIKTNTKPPIFFLPKKQSPTSDKKFRESRKLLEAIIVERKKQLEDEIEELTKNGDKKQEGNDMEGVEEEEEEEGNEETTGDNGNAEITDVPTRDARKVEITTVGKSGRRVVVKTTSEREKNGKVEDEGGERVKEKRKVVKRGRRHVTVAEEDIAVTEEGEKIDIAAEQAGMSITTDDDRSANVPMESEETVDDVNVDDRRKVVEVKDKELTEEEEEREEEKVSEKKVEEIRGSEKEQEPKAMEREEETHGETMIAESPAKMSPNVVSAQEMVIAEIPMPGDIAPGNQEKTETDTRQVVQRSKE